MSDEGLGANTADRSKHPSNSGGSAVLEVDFSKNNQKQGRYAMLYKCLVCGRVVEHPDFEPIEIPDDYAENMVTVLADSAMVRENGIGTGKRKFYYALSHNCSGNGKIVGAAVFAGLRKIEDEEE